MTEAARYIKLVEWSEEDCAFVGQCPGLIGPCCHGADEVEVYRQLCEIVQEWIDLALREGRPLPLPTAGTGAGRRIA
jgi:predicted RNase H-like HicB family nuclease